MHFKLTLIKVLTYLSIVRYKVSTIVRVLYHGGSECIRFWPVHLTGLSTKSSLRIGSFPLAAAAVAAAAAAAAAVPSATMYSINALPPFVQSHFGSALQFQGTG